MDVYVISDIMEYIDADTIIIIRRISKKIMQYYIDKQIDIKSITSVRSHKNVKPHKRLKEGATICSNKMIDYAISKGANEFRYLLFGACSGNHLEMVELAILKGANSWDLTSALCDACQFGHLDLVNCIVEKGENNLELNWGLHNACKYGHLDIVNFMFKNGATRCSFCNRSMQEHLS